MTLNDTDQIRNTNLAIRGVAMGDRSLLRCFLKSKIDWRVVLLLCVMSTVSALALIFWSKSGIREYEPVVTLAYPIKVSRPTIISLALSPDGKRLASSVHNGDRSILTCWDIEKGEILTGESIEKALDDIYPVPEISEKSRLAEVSIPESPLGIQFTHDSKFIVVGYGTCREGCFDPTSKEATYSARGSIQILDSTTLKKLGSIDLNWSVYGLAISPDGKQLAAVGSGKADTVTIGCWDLSTKVEQFLFSFPRSPAIVGISPSRQIMYSNDGELLYVATGSIMKPPPSSRPHNQQSVVPPRPADGELQVIESSTGKILQTWIFPEGAVVWFDVANSPGYIGVNNGLFRLPILDSAVGGTTVEPQVFAPAPSAWYRFLADGKNVVFAAAHRGGGDQAVALYCAGVSDVKTRQTIIGLKGSTRYPQAFTLSNDEQWVAIGDNLGQINVWKLPDMKAIHSELDQE